MNRRVPTCRLLCALIWILIALRAPPVHGNPNTGEARSVTRDADRAYTVVAGEGDGASTVTNPANLGYLRGINGILDVAYAARDTLRRGSGVGAFVGIPLPFRVLALGLGYQFLDPRQRRTTGSSPLALALADEPYSKVTFAAAIPLLRWVPGLSLGLSYSRLASTRNQYADDVNQVDLAVSYWINRFLALGVVGRALNQPETGQSPARYTQPLVLEPELALRPLGDPSLELAVGLRTYPAGMPAVPRFRPGIGEAAVQPRGRLLIGLGGVKLFAEAEGYRHYPVGPSPEPRDAVRIHGGIEFNFRHFGVGGGPILAANGGESFEIQGGTGRVRISREEYEAFVIPRPRRVTRIELASHHGDRGMWRLIEQLETLAQPDNVVLLETDRMSLSYAQLEEVREAMLRARSAGAKMVVYVQGGGLSDYFLASAADRIIAHPHNSLAILGMYTRAFYYAELLGKLGARAEFVRIAEYKGAPETYERTTASKTVARQRRQLRTDVWNHVLRLIARERGQDPLVVKDWIDQAPIVPDRAVRLGIVDALAFPDEIDRDLERWLGKPVRVEQAKSRPEHAEDFGPPKRVAVLLIEGDLLGGESFTIPVLGRKIAGAATLTKEIERLRKDNGVKAVVVRLDTPGGSVAAAESIARELDRLRAEKPVVISMGRICASGGYYIATAGQYIYTDAATVTGSIGIFYPKMDLSGTLDKFGVGVDERGYGDHALLRSWWRPYDEEGRATALRDIRASYELFIQRVARARALSPKTIDEDLARGRVWSGVRAIEVGLADSYGGLREAILRARAIAGLRPAEGEVRLVPEPPTLLQRIQRLFGLRIPVPLGHDKRAGRWQQVTRAAAIGLPSPLLMVLRHLPASLWMLSAPEPLALAPQGIEIE